MTYFVLRIKARLENVRRIYCTPQHRWCFNVEDPSSSETRESVCFTADDEQNIPNSRGKANFIMKWSDSLKYSTINIIQQKDCFNYNSQNEEWADFSFFDCRGIKLSKYIPIDNFFVEDMGGDTYEYSITSESQWIEYSEKLQSVVSVSDIEFDIVTRDKL